MQRKVVWLFEASISTSYISKTFVLLSYCSSRLNSFMRLFIFDIQYLILSEIQRLKIVLPRLYEQRKYCEFEVVISNKPHYFV